jgi:drug/metabolite transporter (DMT)-like permease
VHASPRTRRAWIAWATVCLIWGTTYLAIKIALNTIPPFLMGGLRYFVAGLVLAVALRGSGRPLPARADWPKLALLGFFMLAIGNGGVVWGEQYLASGLTAVIIGTSPFWMVAIDGLLPDGEALHVQQWIGLAMGFGGIVMLVWPEISIAGTSVAHVIAGVFALQLACVGWATASAYTRRHVVPSDVLGVAALQMIFGGAFLLLLGTLMGEWSQMSLTTTTATALVYLTVAGSIIAFVAYSYALSNLPVALVSTYTYVNPVIAVALGVLWLHEPFERRQLLAAAVIIFGMVVVRRGRRRGRRIDTPEEPVHE